MVIAHELAHAALVKRTGGRVPPWLVEGIAMYASGDKRAGDAGALLSGGQLRDRSKQGRPRRALSLTKLAKPSRARPHVAGPAERSPTPTPPPPRTRSRRSTAAQGACCGSTPPSTAPRSRASRPQAHRQRRSRKTLNTSLSSLENDVKAYARANSSLVASLLGRCPSSPKSRRSAAIWPPTSKGGCWRRWTCSTSAGRARSRPPRSTTRSRAAASSGSAAAASTSSGSSPTTSTCSCTCA